VSAASASEMGASSVGRLLSLSGSDFASPAIGGSRCSLDLDFAHMYI
jgi:hypothetical protein